MSGDATATYDAPVGALRSFVTVLVVAHHAVLAYNPFAPPPARSLADWPQLWRAFPVADAARWNGFALVNSFLDLFFMALLFFVSGLFVWPSLGRKGSGPFLRDRLVRLGVPFIVLAGVVAPLAYVPSYLQTGATPSLGGFWHDFLAGGDWSAGPAWFLWLLLAFDGLAAAVHALWPRHPAAPAPARPLRLVALLLVASALAYLPLVMTFGPFDWLSVGPFQVQKSRVLHYAVYFAAGVIAGAGGTGLLAKGGALARRWPAWAVAVPVAFLAAQAIFERAFMAPTIGMGVAAGLAFVVACGASCFGLLAVFARFVRRQDRMRRDAYGVYVVHYAIVSWLALALVGAALPGVAKGVLVTVGALAASWALTAALRRIPAVARIV
jgi:Acyltransferase family